MFCLPFQIGHFPEGGEQGRRVYELPVLLRGKKPFEGHANVHFPLRCDVMRTLALVLLASALASAEQNDDAEKGCPALCRCTSDAIVCRNVGLDSVPVDLPAGETKYTKL